MKAAQPEIKYIFLEYTRRSEDYDPFFQDAVDAYVSGEINYAAMLTVFSKSFNRPELFGPPKQVLDIASELGLKIVLNDGDVWADRNAAMTDEIVKVLARNPNEKAIVIVGSAHLTGESSFLPGDSTGVPELLSQLKFGSKSILIRTAKNIEEQNKLFGTLIAAGYSEPIGFTTLPDGPEMIPRSWEWQKKLPRWSDFSAVIIVP